MLRATREEGFEAQTNGFSASGFQNGGLDADFTTLTSLLDQAELGRTGERVAALTSTPPHR